MIRRFVVTSLALVAAVVGGSCGREESPSPQGAAGSDAFEVRKHLGAGPVKFTVELSAQSITTADALRCRLTLDVAEGYEAEFPDLAFPDDVPGLILTSHDERESAEGKRRLRICEYELEPEYEGKVKWPAMEVYYHRQGEVGEERLEMEPIEIQVESTPTTAEGLALRPIHGLVTVEQIEAARRRIWPWIVASVLAAGVLVTLGVYLVRRPRPAARPRPAHEVALDRLRQLAERDLIATGQAEPFFVEVTTIARDYIEQAFGVRAPEQTTEEFLLSMVTEPKVARHREVLQPFLTAADEVKFARLVPDRAAMQRAFDTAENFVVQSSGGEGRKR